MAMIESTALGTASSNEGHRLGSLTPSQILYLEQGHQRLYVELIQILRDRNMGWLRPLCLCSPVSHQIPAPFQKQTEPDPDNHSMGERKCYPPVATDESKRDASHQMPQIVCDGTSFALHDMRHSSDLLWPLGQCNIVLDLDAIPILSSLGPEPIHQENRDHARRALNIFMNKIWNGATND